MRQKHINLTAYDDCELKEFYDTPEKLDEYRRHLFLKTEGQKEFISKLFSGKFTMLEACSGNSRLLYSLAPYLIHGVGVEISKPRYEFAEAWKKALAIHNITNINSDIMKYESRGECDLVAIMTNAFMYFEPIDRTYPLKLLKRCNTWLRPSGKLIMELRDYGSILNSAKCNGNKATVEITFPKADPFVGTKTTYKWDAENKYLDLNEVFTGRAYGAQYDRHEILRVYNLNEIKELLGQAGFKKCSVYKNTVAPEPSEDKIIVIAEK